MNEEVPTGISAAGGYSPVGHLRGPRLQAKFVEGRVSEVALSARTSMGRHPNNTLRLMDREVSKEHAVVERIGNGFVLRDLNSSNGTFVNGRKIKELRLRDGDRIMVGATEMVFFSGYAEGLPSSSPGVTIVATAQSMPAFLAQVEQKDAGDFKPIEEIHDEKQLRDDYERLRIAVEFQSRVGTEREPRKLMEKILEVSFKLLKADNAVIFPTDEQGALILDTSGQPAAVKLSQNQSDAVEVSMTVLERCVQTKKGVLTADAILDARFSASESIVAQGIRSAMAVPLIAKGGLRGILFCDTRKRTNAFTEKDLNVLSSIAAQAATALENAELASKVWREEQTRAELSRFLSPKVAEMVAERVASGEGGLSSGGELAEITSLFVDIRGFTSMAEAEKPHETVDMLNTFFTAMANIVFKHEGNLDKFIGDCVMAVWGPPSKHPDDAARAMAAALEMQTAVDEINRQRAEEGKNALEVGVGVNTGDAVVGYMGSAERHEFTAIGDSVNTASRLCGMAKAHEILVSEMTVRRATASGKRFKVEPVSVLQVKGKEKGVPTFRVLGLG